MANLHACSLSLLLYADGSDGLKSLPSMETAQAMLPASTTCDPEDYFRSSCQTPTEAPLIGSYAYVRGLHGLDTSSGWNDFLQANPSPYILASTFYGEMKVSPWSGDENDPCIGNGSCYLPSTLIRILPDGSAHELLIPANVQPGPGYHPLFFWSAVFETP